MAPLCLPGGSDGASDLLFLEEMADVPKANLLVVACRDIAAALRPNNVETWLRSFKGFDLESALIAV
jgi:hypothetical protein